MTYRENYTLDKGWRRRASRQACNAGAVRGPAHRWRGLLRRFGVRAGLSSNARACCRARRSLSVGVGVGDRRIAVGIGLLGGVGRITRTRPDVLGPGAQLDLTAAVGAGPGLLAALVYDLAVLTASGGA